MTDFEQQFPNYFVTQDGVVYKNGEVLKPFKSNKYLQVVLYDTLEVQSRVFHSRNHAKENDNFKFSRRGKPSWNKGMKMSEEFCDKCSVSAKRRGFNGNQYIKCK